ncbi:MAG: O-antigen ligase family protein [Methyloligellaceae bacterium]
MSLSSAADFSHAAGPVSRPRSAVHSLALVLVWLTFAASSFVFAEPAPYDILMMGLIFALPLLRLADVTPRLMVLLGLWLLIAAGGILAVTQAYDIERPLKHTLITLYLSFSGVLVAAFVRNNPERHARLIMSGWAVAAFIAASAAAIGYFKALPGAYDVFTEYGRATGPFKDANVFGPFIVPVLLYGLHMTVVGSARRTLGVVFLVPLLLFGILITFSRGAWIHAVVSLLAYAYLAFATAPTHSRRLKLVMFGLLGAGVAVAVIASALQVGQIAELFNERAALTQSYDVGPEGRFGGHAKALGLILENPLGLGAIEFGYFYHNEDVHNVYLAMFLNAGWLGGLLYLALVLMTLVMGFSHAIRATPTRGLMIVALATFAGLAVLGLVIDTDHWRHFFVVMGLIWGLAATPRRAA